MSTAPSDSRPDAIRSIPGGGSGQQKGEDRGRGVRVRTGVVIAGVIVLVLALLGAGIWYGASREIGQGPNAFILATGSLQPGHMTYQYTTFAGLAREKSSVTAGQSVHLTYTTHVTKGSLSVEVKDPIGNSVWRVNVPQNRDRSGAATIRAARTGAYQVIITGLDAGGKFDVAWHVR